MLLITHWTSSYPSLQTSSWKFLNHSNHSKISSYPPPDLPHSNPLFLCFSSLLFPWKHHRHWLPDLLPCHWPPVLKPLHQFSVVPYPFQLTCQPPQSIQLHDHPPDGLCPLALPPSCPSEISISVFLCRSWAVWMRSLVLALPDISSCPSFPAVGWSAWLFPVPGFCFLQYLTWVCPWVLC